MTSLTALLLEVGQSMTHLSMEISDIESNILNLNRETAELQGQCVLCYPRVEISTNFGDYFSVRKRQDLCELHQKSLIGLSNYVPVQVSSVNDHFTSHVARVENASLVAVAAAAKHAGILGRDALEESKAKKKVSEALKQYSAVRRSISDVTRRRLEQTETVLDAEEFQERSSSILEQLSLLEATLHAIDDDHSDGYNSNESYHSSESDTESDG